MFRLEEPPGLRSRSPHTGWVESFMVPPQQHAVLPVAAVKEIVVSTHPRNKVKFCRAGKNGDQTTIGGVA